MLNIVNLRHFPCFRNPGSLQDINRLAGLHNKLMPHQVAAATGCTIYDAMSLLMLLHVKSLAEPFLLVYHHSDPSDPPTPILARGILEGLPSLPIICDVCGKQIDDRNELSYDFLFKITNQVQFAL